MYHGGFFTRFDTKAAEYPNNLVDVGVDFELSLPLKLVLDRARRFLFVVA